MIIIGIILVFASIILTLVGILADKVLILVFPPILVICGAYLIIKGHEKERLKTGEKGNKHDWS